MDPTSAESLLHAISDPGSVLELDELRRALSALSAAQREAVMLIGGGAMAMIPGQVDQILQGAVCYARATFATPVSAGSMQGFTVRLATARGRVAAGG